MDNNLINATVNTLSILLAVFLIGLFIELLQKCINILFCKLFGRKFTYIFFNKITFLGVMHHELSHALFVILTGAKLEEVHLFKVDEADNSLGSVTYSARGPLILRCFQYILIAIAPVICGSLSIFCILYFIHFDVWWKFIIFGFILFCIFIHMNSSTQDIKIALKGVPIVLFLMFTIFYFTNFNLIDWLCQLVFNH